MAKMRLTLLTVISLASFMAVSGCHTIKKKSKRYVSQQAFLDINAKLKTGRVSFEDLKDKGPFQVREYKNLRLAIDIKEDFLIDYARPNNDEAAPLVIFHHGNKYIKEAHWNQVKRLASWGFHSVTLQSKNEYNWVKNGLRIQKLVNILARSPEMLSPNIMGDKIILAGHSFGGSAVTIASSKSKYVKGIILLDPAVVSNLVLKHQKKSSVDAVLLGADTRVFQSRKRDTFFKNMKKLSIELSVNGATHNDAQNPPITAKLWGNDPTTSKERVELFTHLITASAFYLYDRSHTQFYQYLLEDYKENQYLSLLRYKDQAPKDKKPADMKPDIFDNFDILDEI